MPRGPQDRPHGELQQLPMPQKWATGSHRRGKFHQGRWGRTDNVNLFLTGGSIGIRAWMGIKLLDVRVLGSIHEDTSQNIVWSPQLIGSRELNVLLFALFSPGHSCNPSRSNIGKNNEKYVAVCPDVGGVYPQCIAIQCHSQWGNTYPKTLDFGVPIFFACGYVSRLLASKKYG